MTERKRAAAINADSGEQHDVRLDYAAAAPDAIEAMRGLGRVVESSTLEPLLLELVKVRASQINGCAHCLDMHAKDARAIGEDKQRLHLVAVWREAPSFTPRERAALAWTEALTLLPETGAPDDVYEAMACDKTRPVSLRLPRRRPQRSGGSAPKADALSTELQARDGSRS